MSKPSKVLIIGSGPIIIGQFYCHSEGAKRLKNPYRRGGDGFFATLRMTEWVERMTEWVERMTEWVERMTEWVERMTERRTH